MAEEKKEEVNVWGRPDVGSSVCLMWLFYISDHHSFYSSRRRSFESMVEGTCIPAPNVRRALSAQRADHCTPVSMETIGIWICSDGAESDRKGHIH